MYATVGGGTLIPRGINNSDYSRVDLNYQPVGQQQRDFITSRLDYNITSLHHLSFVYNYDKYTSIPDFLNNVVAAFPGTGVTLGSSVNTGQNSNRFAGTLSLRSQFGSHVTNEWRGGLNGGTVLFFPDVGPGMFTTWRGYRPIFGATYVSGVTTATSSQRRNAPVKDIADNVSVMKGAHLISFGGEFTQINSWQLIASTDTMPTITFNTATGDPILNTFVAGNMPLSTATNQTDAATLYSILTGRVSAISKQLVLDEKTHQYGATPPIDRNRQREYGGYVQDTWRAKHNLTINAGLRFEKQGQYENLNGLYSRVGYQSLWGLSGVGNLFSPGTLTGVTPSFVQQTGTNYNIPTALAPSLGMAWQVPKMDGILGMVFGNHEGASVLRMGYSLSTVREGQNLLIGLWGANQGITQTASVSNSTTPADFGAAGSVLFRQGTLPTKSGLTSTPTYPIPAGFTTSLNDFKPNMSLGYVQSWNIGWQRELGKDSVVEVRYTGNHGVHLWRQYNLNEVNIFENGFLKEFQVAQNNLRIARGGDITKNTSVNNWGNTGLAGQAATPMLQTAIGNTTDTSLSAQLLLGQAGGAANAIATNAGRMANLTAASSTACGGKPCPVNLFLVNPTVGSGGSFVETNDGSSYYDALQIEMRRRMSHGISIQSSYVFSKSLANGPSNSSTSVSQPTTLRNMGIDKVPSGFDMRHAFKVNYIYELPVGPGKQLLGNIHGFFGKIFEGWETAGVIRVQSGSPFFLNGLATFDQVTSNTGVVLHNMTSSDLQQAVNIRKATGADGKGIVYYLPQSLINNSLAAFNTGGFTPAQLDPNAPYIGPAAAGQLGWRGYLYANWNRFFDASVVKRTTIHEKINVEFRASALNIFNLTNFGNSGSGTAGAVQYGNIGSTFGQVTGAYRDISGTVEPGGRILEFMLRFNF